MGTITINVSDDVEHKFRHLIYEEFGTRKGMIGKATEQALSEYIAKKKQEEVTKRLIALLEKGFDLGGFKIKSRAELHER